MVRELETFLADETSRNEWVRYHHGGPKGVSMKIYLRRCHRSHLPVATDLDIASVGAEPMGRGGFTALLNLLEPRYAIFVENVFNDRLSDYLQRRGYHQTNGQTYPPCFAKAKAKT